MASKDDIDILIKVRFDYFDTEELDISPEQKVLIETNLKQYYSKHIGLDFYAAFVETDGEIASVAFLAIAEKPANLSWPTGKIGTMLNVLTFPKYRRKRYATSILNELIGEARKQKLSYIELSASESGKPLYHKLGFMERKSSNFVGMKLNLL